MKFNRQFFLLILIFVGSLAFRLNGLFDNHPLWVDEFSTANQAELLGRYGFHLINNNALFFEFNKLTSALIGLLGLQFFGHHEWALRIFFVMIGSLIPLAVYRFSKYIGPQEAALPAALLATTSYFLITWSRQARSYSLQVLLMVIATYLYLVITHTKPTKKKLIAYAGVALIGIFTHPFFYIVLVSHACSYLLTSIQRSKNTFKKENISALLIIVLVAGLTFLGKNTVEAYLGKLVSISNNLWLYHAYLWREYGMITLIGSLGLLLGLYQKRTYFLPIILHAVFHTIFITFFFATATTRYTLPLFPWFFIGMGYLFAVTTDSLFSKRILKIVIPLGVVFGIIINGYKFDLKPNKFYSVNHDFREIALIDYKQMYDIIQTKGDLAQGHTAIIETWVDRAMWYVGPDYPALYNFRWIDAGVMKRTPYEMNEAGEKVLTKRTNVGFISDVKDLQTAMSRYPRGFLIIDDTSMPQDVIQFAQKNFRKELFLNRYPLDDNPLSDWPITLYSWGYGE